MSKHFETIAYHNSCDYVASLPDPRFEGSSRTFTEKDIMIAYQSGFIEAKLETNKQYCDLLREYNWDGVAWTRRVLDE